MLKLDNDLLQELGLGGLPDDQKQAMLQYIYETLELRVGTNLANQMTDEQLDEFEKFIDDKGEANQAQALQWLEANLPNYKQVVNEVFEQLKVEIRQMAPQLLAANGPAQPVQAPVAQSTLPPAAPIGPQPATSAQGGYGPQQFNQSAGVPYYTTAQTQFYGQQPVVSQPMSYQPVGVPQQGPQSPAPFQPVAGPAAQPAYDPTAFAAPTAQPSVQGQDFGQALQQPPVQPQPPQQDSQAYQFPAQQPPAGPGGYPQRPN